MFNLNNKKKSLKGSVLERCEQSIALKNACCNKEIMTKKGFKGNFKIASCMRCEDDVPFECNTMYIPCDQMVLENA